MIKNVKSMRKNILHNSLALTISTMNPFIFWVSTWAPAVTQLHHHQTLRLLESFLLSTLKTGHARQHQSRLNRQNQTASEAERLQAQVTATQTANFALALRVL